MKLWEVKAQSLRLMFADSDIQFIQSDFEGDKPIYENPNTAEKLVRMEDSIRRAIDVYYRVVGTHSSVSDLQFATDQDYIDLVAQTTLDYPMRIDALIYDVDEDLNETLRITHSNIDYYFDYIGRKIYFHGNEYDYTSEDKVVFRVFYKLAEVNLPYTTINELTYDLNDLNIPLGVQNVIPYFVKGELYEEDEAGVSASATRKYYSYLYSLKKPFTRVQKKVKRSRVFDKTN